MRDDIGDRPQQPGISQQPEQRRRRAVLVQMLPQQKDNDLLHQTLGKNQASQSRLRELLQEQLEAAGMEVVVVNIQNKRAVQTAEQLIETAKLQGQRRTADQKVDTRTAGTKSKQASAVKGAAVFR